MNKKIKQTRKNIEGLQDDYERDSKKLSEKDEDYERKRKKLKANYDDDLETEEKKGKRAQNELKETQARILKAASSGEGGSNAGELKFEWEKA